MMSGGKNEDIGDNFVELRGERKKISPEIRENSCLKISICRIFKGLFG